MVECIQWRHFVRKFLVIMRIMFSQEEHLVNLGHPDTPTVNLDRVSHKIVSLKESGSNFIGKAKILGTPMGKIASSLIDEGVKLGVSSRGIGSLNQPVKV